MSQARVRSFQTAKSLNHLKVCSGTNTSRSYCSDSFFKALSFAKKIDRLHSGAIIECQNPSGFYRETSMSFQIKFDGVSGNIPWNRQGSGTRYLILNRSYSGMVNSQVSSSTQFNEKSDEAGKGRKLLDEFDFLCKDRKLKEAVEILGLLEQHKVSINMPRYLFLMNECGESQALQEAKHVHNHLTRWLPHPDFYIHNKILEMYLKCGSMEDAFEVFDKTPQRNLRSWDTMITWLAKTGHGEEAIDLFTELKRVELKPDNQMFHGVFAACSVVGDMREGLLHFESMIKTYNLVPSMDDYVSVVAMLGSSGYLNEALEFIEKMPIEPSVEIWETMMNQSRVHGDFKLGEHCADLVNLLDPSRLDEQSKEGLIPIKPSDIAKGKEKSSQLIPLKSETKHYEFRARDTSHPNHEKIYSQLRCLKESMKEVGYVPETRVLLSDVDQESKEEALLSQSDKLALSQALLATPARETIHITSNLRRCIDSHNALKIVSGLLGRKIIVKEHKRVHQFENGVCSCLDYW